MAESPPLPSGYTTLVPLDPAKHRGKSVSPGAVATFCASQISFPVGFVEFFQACKHFPIVFIKAESRMVPMAICGISPAENLFCNKEGTWRAHVYVPAYVRRFPFFVVRTNDTAGQRVICVDEAALEDSQLPYFTLQGGETTIWSSQKRLIDAMEGSTDTSTEMCAALVADELLEPFHVKISHGGRTEPVLNHLFRVSESRLNQLPMKRLRDHQRKGYLSRIYAHLISLDNFQLLQDLRAE